jgi:hypothetical protein
VDQGRIAAQYVKKIRTSCVKTVKSILETAALLNDAKAKVERGMFAKMFQNHKEPIGNPLPFSHNTADRLMAIGKRFKGVKSATLQNLPASYAALYELSLLPVKTVERLAKKGTVNADASVRDIQTIVAKHRSPKNYIAPTEPLPYVYQVNVMCNDEAHQTELLDRFQKEGLTAKALIT